MDIHVGMMLKFPVGKLIGWVIDNEPYQYGLAIDLMRYRVEWVNGSITSEAVANIKTYRNKWLELEKAHERLSNND
jgi:hypothetical protein